jgi:hypothetical protein
MVMDKVAVTHTDMVMDMVTETGMVTDIGMVMAGVGGMVAIGAMA